MNTSIMSSETKTPTISMADAFLITGAIDDKSPASESGLRAGDMILRFGMIDKKCFKSVPDTIAPYLLYFINQKIEIVVGRKNGMGEDEIHTVIVIPRKWKGFGVLGCHLYYLMDRTGAFMKITTVLKGSPADIADLRPKDRVVEFGTIKAETFVDIEKSIVPFLKNHGLGTPIPVLVQRTVFGVDEFVPIKITPQLWGGEGVLGCDLYEIREHSTFQKFADKFTGGFVSDSLSDGLGSSLGKKTGISFTLPAFGPFGGDKSKSSTSGA